MKKLFLLVLVLFVLLPTTVFAALSDEDKKEITSELLLINNAVNEQMINEIYVSPNAKPELLSEIKDKLENMTVRLDQDITSFEEIDENKVTVHTTFAAKGIGWEMSGLTNYYTFERQNGQWILLDTDFHKKLGPEAVLELLGKIAIVVVPLSLIFWGFWLWMLIDALKREFPEKTMWLIIIFLAGGLGAILYFFMIRRKLIMQQKSQPMNVPPQPVTPPVQSTG